MKNKILALLATIGLASSVTAVEINENLSINGFIDGSYGSLDADADANPNGAGLGVDEEYLGIDEVEINFLLNVGNVSGAIHLDSNDLSGNGDELIDIEQAHFTYSLDNGVSFTFGRYGAALGFEREDPAGLYTYSRAYEDNANGYDLGNIDSANAGSVEGVTVAYAGEDFSIAASFEEGNDVNLDTEDLNIELSFSYTGFENLVLGGGYFFDNQKNTTPSTERDVFNIHAAYTAGKALIAGEFIGASDDTANSGEDAFLVLVDYDFTDKLGGALRYSQWETTDALESSKFTIAPNYAITDSLGAILEYSSVDVDAAPGNNEDYDYLALELTYTF